MQPDKKAADSIFLYDGQELAYAENKCQNPAHIFSTRSNDPLAPTNFERVSGTPSFISMADAVQVMEVLCLLAESFRRTHGNAPYIVVAGKHGNPCGAAISFDDPLDAIRKALMGDTVAVMGGEVITNFRIDEKEAYALFRTTTDIGRENWGLDLVVAPGFSEGAALILGKREKRRLLSNPALNEAPFPQYQWVYRQARTDWLRQAAPTFVLTPNEVQFWSGKAMNSQDFDSALIAWACCWRASSNTVALAADNMLIGIGCGQQDRIACVRLCLDRANRAGHDTIDSVFASDGFFPYPTSKLEWTGQEQLDLRYAMEEAKRLLEFYTPDEAIKSLSSVSATISRMDRREGPQLLADAGCIGGIVPADGKELENVRQFFQDKEMAVGFIPPQFRGFSKH